MVVLPHGYPSSSYQFRNLMPALTDRWRLVAPDFRASATTTPPDTPDRADFAYTFDAHADFLQRFVRALELPRYAIWLHDYGSQFGLRLAMADPDRVAGLIIQNGDIYEDQHGPKYEPLKALGDPDAGGPREAQRRGQRGRLPRRVRRRGARPPGGADHAGPVAAALGATGRY